MDGRKIVVVNGEYEGDDLIGDYIHDFVSCDVEDMRLDSVRNCVKYFKLEKERGFENMCEIIEQYARDETREAIEKLEEENKTKIENVEADRNKMLNFILNQIRKGVLNINDASIELGIPKTELELMI